VTNRAAVDLEALKRAASGGVANAAKFRNYIPSMTVPTLDLLALIAELEQLRENQGYAAGYERALRDVRASNTSVVTSWRCYVRDIVDALITDVPASKEDAEKDDATSPPEAVKP
jgi:hypothetical protein